MKRVLWLLTGGRPMVDEGFAFRDVVSGRPVHYYRDKLGRRWLAEPRRWDFFRVSARLDPRNNEKEMAS